MPAALTAFVSALGTAIGGTTGAFLIMNAGAIASGLIVGGMLALSAASSARAKRKQREAYNASQVDRLANVVTTVAQRELVLGRVRKGGPIIFRGSAGQYKTSFLMHIALAAHEIDAVEQIYFNDQPVTLDGGGLVLTSPYYRTRRQTSFSYITVGNSSVTLPHTPVPGSVVAASGSVTGEDSNYASGPVPPEYISGNTVTLPAPTNVQLQISYQYDEPLYFARVWWDLGAGTAVADARTAQLFPELITSAHRGQGIAKLFVEFTYDETAFPTGVPAVTALVRGAKVYDPRSGLTVWSENPALLMRHVYQHPHFGKATISSAEDARFVTAANACETSQAWDLTDGTTSTTALYRAGIVAPFGGAARDVLDDLAQAMGGMWAYMGGEIQVRAGVFTASVKTFTDSDLAVVQREGEAENQEQVSVVVHRERAQKFNVVNPRIWDAGQDYKAVALTPVKSDALIERDGSELAQEVTLTAVGFAPQAQHICGMMMRDARDPLTVEAPFKMTAWPVEVFDTVSWTSDRYGWTAKAFMVMSRRWDRDRGVVWLTLKETAAAIFTPDAEFLPQGYAENTSNPNPWDVEPPHLTAENVFSGTDELLVQGDGTITTRLRVVWPALADSSLISGLIDVDWSVDGGVSWTTLTVPGDATQVVIVGPTDGQVALLRARSRNSIATSIWSVQVAHQVVGKTESPDDVESFTIDGDVLRWTAVDDADLAGYRIRFNYGVNTFWSGGAPLHDGLLTSSPYTMASRPAGQVTLLIKAVDTSGNESANAAAIVTDLGDAPIHNILFSYPEAPDFTGTITDGAVSGSVLEADSVDLFYGDDSQPFYGADSDDFYPAGTFAQMLYEWFATPDLAGTLVLLHTITASDFVIEYARDSQDAFYGADGDLFYGADADAFYGTPGTFQVWPGYITLTAAEGISFRVTTAGGPTQGRIETLTVVLDVPDIVEELQDVVISSGGTRLPITQTYSAIDTVQLTVQADGNGGIAARIDDKDAELGPLITVLNAAGTAVAGLVDASIKGH